MKQTTHTMPRKKQPERVTRDIHCRLFDGEIDEFKELHEALKVEKGMPNLSASDTIRLMMRECRASRGMPVSQPQGKKQ